MATLYLVATPIGNLEDITFRAVRILREVPLIAAEDTRTARKLLARYDIHTPLISYHDFSAAGRLEELLSRLERADLALVSEAGMPAISDPGYRLVVAAIARGVAVVPVPGPSAVLAALAASGLPTDSFVFLGFLPNRAGPRRRALESVAGEPRTLVVYESPHRLLEALADVEQTLGDRPIVVARELTKLHEELWRGSVSAARRHFEQAGVRGEITLVIAGAPPAEPPAWSEDDVRRAMEEALARGLDRRAAAKEVAAHSGWPRRAVYRLGLADDAPRQIKT